MRFDAVVVGGGPAGATCAYKLRKSGLKVLLLEKEKLPRFKSCAGCLSARIEKLLPEGWHSLIKHTIRVGTLGYMGEESFTLSSPKPLAYIVDRSQFDRFLVEKAKEIGVEVWEGYQFLGFEEGKIFRVITDKGNVQTEFLIGADGFYSKVAKALGYRKDKFFRSLEFICETGLRDEVRIDVGLVRRGYAWVFPTSVGIASTGKENLLEVLKTYVKKLGVDTEATVKGWHIPFIERDEDFHSGRGRVLLIGDASNCVDPLLGEGIYYAIYGANIVVESILKSPANPHREYLKLSKPMIRELIYAGRISKIAYRFQRFAYKWGKKGALRSYYRLLTGETTYKALFFKAWLNLLEVVPKSLMGPPSSL